MPKITKYNGGYVIISLNDEDIYEKIERNLYKPILLTDIVINGIEKNDVFTTAYVEGTNIVFKDIYDKDITITQDNVVSIDDNAKHLYRHDVTINVDIPSENLSGYFSLIILNNNAVIINDASLKDNIANNNTSFGSMISGIIKKNGEEIETGISIHWSPSKNGFNIHTSSDNNVITSSNDIIEVQYDIVTKIF